MVQNTGSPQKAFEELRATVKNVKLSVVGHEDIFDVAEVMLMNAVLQAYGQSEQGFVYAEPSLLDARKAPPDLVLAHPDVGVVVFECKAYDLTYIKGSEAGSLRIIRNGREILVNPLRQGRHNMFAIKNVFEKYAGSQPRPFFHAMVALPNISEEEWCYLGYDRCIDTRYILFQEQVANPDLLRQRVNALIDETRAKTGLKTAYPLESEPILRRIFGDSAVINDARQTVLQLDPNSLGAEIVAMERAHKYLSAEQERLSRANTWGRPYLVRGVAGSGKSIVLANQVARYLHRHAKQQLSLFDDDVPPPPKIAVVCFNRSLVPLLRDRIQRAYAGLSYTDPLPNNLVVTDLNHLLYNISQRTELFKYLTVDGRQHNMARRAQRHLEQLELLRSEHPSIFEIFTYDAIFVDEGQDAHPDEYALLRLLVRPNPETGERTLVIFYDDAQNIYGNPPPTWQNLSLNVSGGRSAFMTQAYRNSREILEMGMNVLLGTHARPHTRVATRRFMDVYTLQEKKLVEETKYGWRVYFAESSNILPQVRPFNSRLEQLDWVAEALVSLLEQDQVLPEHIMVVSPNSKSFRYLAQRVQQLSKNPLKIRMVGGAYSEHIDDLLIQPEHLTLCTIHVSKGYDAPIVIMIDTDMIMNTVEGRAMFFVGVTRAKRYLLITGLDLPNTLMREAVATHAVLEKLSPPER
ncbi:MAG: hypothetical protein CUN55_01395 [Phototrophicales bacterium]|nr:MAG: hypothetical protein CUN55_01395 [Phototrophicales bacterium]